MNRWTGSLYWTRTKEGNVVKKNFLFYSLTLVGIPFIFFLGNVSTFRVHFPSINYQIFIFIIIINSSSSSSLIHPHPHHQHPPPHHHLYHERLVLEEGISFPCRCFRYKKKLNCFSLLKKIKLLFSLWKKTIKLTFFAPVENKEYK